jgi:hypothetical protein
MMPPKANAQAAWARRAPPGRASQAGESEPARRSPAPVAKCDAFLPPRPSSTLGGCAVRGIRTLDVGRAAWRQRRLAAVPVGQADLGSISIFSNIRLILFINDCIFPETAWDRVLWVRFRKLTSSH